MIRTPSLTRDRDYATFVEDERTLLQRCAFLLVGRRDAADELVQATLADLYVRWRRVRDPRLVAMRLLYTTDLDAAPVWSPRARFELVDGRPPTVETTDPTMAALQSLSARQRMVVVLEYVVRLSSVDIAAVLDSSVETVQDVSREARAALVRSDPTLADDGMLVARLDRAVPADVRAVRRYDDLRRGQEVLRRRWLRRLGLVAACAVVLVLVVSQLRPMPQTPSSAPAPAPATSTVTVSANPAPDCDRRLATCQAAVTRAWRAGVVGAVSNYLDPRGTYLNASSYYARDEVGDLWGDKQGGLAVEVFRVGGGSTSVYVQAATDDAYAPRCGATTSNRCSPVRFMDGNTYTLSDASHSADEIEGQYFPVDEQVVTVVVLNRGRGPSLTVGRAQVIQLLHDRGLRLPTL